MSRCTMAASGSTGSLLILMSSSTRSFSRYLSHSRPNNQGGPGAVSAPRPRAVGTTRQRIPTGYNGGLRAGTALHAVARAGGGRVQATARAPAGPRASPSDGVLHAGVAAAARLQRVEEVGDHLGQGHVVHQRGARLGQVLQWGPGGGVCVRVGGGRGCVRGYVWAGGGAVAGSRSQRRAPSRHRVAASRIAPTGGVAGRLPSTEGHQQPVLSRQG